MKKVKLVLALIFPIFLIMGILATSGYAKKPPSPGTPKPEIVAVSGDINGTGDAVTIAIEFSATFGPYAGLQQSNGDKPLSVAGVRKGSRTLVYYFDPADHKGLVIRGGYLEGRKETEQVVWPIGSVWEISSKATQGVIFSGTLNKVVIYKKLD